MLPSDNFHLSKAISTAARPLATEGRIAVQSIAQVPTAEDIARYVAAATSDNTRRAYQGDLADFIAFGATIPASPELVAAYVADRAQRHSPATVLRRLIGIGRAHTALGYDDPTRTELVKTVARGARRLHGRPQRQAAPLLREDLLVAVSRLSGGAAIRDRALLLLGFATAMRRSELVSLDITDLEFCDDGVTVSLRRSKTDQEGRGRRVAVPWGHTAACPVAATRAWLEFLDCREGPLFRAISKGGGVGAERLSAASVSLIVKRAAEAVGLCADRFSSHSLRAGLVTSAVRAGVSLPKIQAQTGHRTIAILSRYIRDAQLFEGNAVSSLL